MKNPVLALLLMLCSSGAFTTLTAQTDPGGGDPADPAANGVASDPCITGASTWFLGGNNIIPSTPVNGGISMNHTDIGTCNNFPFILKANNFQSVWVTQTGQIGINTSLPQSALDITHPNSTQPRTWFRVYGDADGNVESTGDMRLHWATGNDMLFNEGPVGNALNWMVVKGSTGRVGIGESNPGAALDIKSSNTFNSANFRIHGDIFGNVVSDAAMNLNYAYGSDFRINEGPAYTTAGAYPGTNRLRIFANTGYILAGKPDANTPFTRFHIVNEPIAAGPQFQYGLRVDQFVDPQNVGNGHWIVGSHHLVSAPTHVAASGIGIEAVSYIKDEYDSGGNFNKGLVATGKGGNFAVGVESFGEAMNDNEPGEPWARSTAHAFLGYASPTPNGNGFGIEVYAIKEPHQTGDVFAGRFWGDVEIFGNIPPSSQAAQIPAPPGVPALFVSGNAVTTGNNWYVSDKQLKSGVKTLENASSLLQKLNPVSYTFKHEEYNSLNLPHGEQMGLIAQELEEVFPELVMRMKGRQIADKDGNKITHPEISTVNYVGLIPVLIAGLQEQISRNDEQQDQIEQLKAEIAGIKRDGDIRSREIQTGSTVPAAQLENAIVLDQNVPNPFNESTVISYFVPQDSRTAMIVFTSEDGRTTRSVNLQPRGAGRITVFAEDLTHGTYTYSLVIDGRTVESKRMIRQ